MRPRVDFVHRAWPHHGRHHTTWRNASADARLDLEPAKWGMACRAGQPDFDAVTLLGGGSITKALQVQMKPECVVELVHQFEPECPNDWADTLDRNRSDLLGLRLGID